jgi:hypothetical protein
MIDCAAQRIQPAMQSASGVFTIPKSGGDEAGSGAAIARDAVELSDRARAKATAGESATMRVDLVQRVRSEIEAGTYLTEQKLDAVVNRLHRELFAE